jgi:hypothetical protein
MSKSLKAIIEWFNNQNTMLLVFILCMANFFGLTLEGGEEQYFAFAKQYMDPFWMPNSFTLNHPAGGNLIFQVIVGFLLRYLSFEQVAIWGRTINFIMYAIPLALIFRKLKITNIEVLFLLQVLFFSHQSLFAGEWIFKNLEEKTLAYVFVFWSLYFLLGDKPVLSACASSAATYFHFLAGGWMAAFVFVYFVLRPKKMIHAFLGGISYVALTFPLILYLYNTYMVDNPAIVNGVNTNAVYAFWRLKHHIGMFSDAHYFFAHAFLGVLMTIAIFLLCVFVFRKIKDSRIVQLNTLNIIILSQQILFMVIGIFDTNGVLMKTYPFRTNSLMWFLFLVEMVLVARLYMPRAYHKIVPVIFKTKEYPSRKLAFTNSVGASMLVIGLAVMTFETHDMLKNLKSLHNDLDSEMLEMIEYIKKTTPGSDIFMMIDSDRPLSFIRRAERERFVVVKFTPTRSTAIYEWHKRALLKKRIKRDIRLIDSVKTVYQVNYLLTDSTLTYPSVTLEKRIGKHSLYKVK